MAILNSFADVTRDVKELLAAVDANAATMPELATAKTDLEQLLTQMQDLSARRNASDGDRAALFEELGQFRQKARDRSSEVRNYLRFKLGKRNPKLREFKVTPLQATLATKKSGSRKMKAPETPPVAPTTPDTPTSTG